MEKFTALNFHSLNPTDVLQKYFHIFSQKCLELKSCSYIHRKTFVVLLKSRNHESLAQRIFPQLRYLFSSHTLAWACDLHLKLQYYLFPLYLSHFSTNFNATCTTVYPMHALHVQQYADLSYHLKLLQRVLYTAE